MNENFLTHNGRLTMVNTATTTWRTLQVQTQPDHSRFAPGKRVIALLNGPDNTSNYKAFGFVKNGIATPWRKFRGTKYETFCNMVNFQQKWEAKGVEYLFEGTCRRCNRPLTVPESIKSGIGPVCAGKE